RQRWGLGFARIAADTLGGAVTAPYDSGGGTGTASFEVGLGRLALPVAGLRGRHVLRAARSWDEETGLTPGSEAPLGSRVAWLRDAAMRTPGRIVSRDGWQARAGRALLWMAIPPDDVTERARDVIAGLVHERALTDQLAEPDRSRISALAI